MREIEKKVIDWAEERSLNDPIKQTLKTLSEAGELADAVCKSRINNSEIDPYDLFDNGELDDVIDAIGDIEVCLIILKSQLKIPQNHALECAFDVISKRTGETKNGTFIKDK